MDTALFVASKLIGALIRVETWIVAVLVVVVIAQMAGWLRLALGMGIGALVAVLLLSILPLGDLLLRPLERAYPADPPLVQVDGIIVLGGSTNQAASLFWNQPQIGEAGDRITAAVALSRRFPQARMVFTGGSGRLRDLGGAATSEASVARELFASLGVDLTCITFEDRSRNTAENARLSLPLAEPKAGEVWLLVTSAYHMPRSMARFEAVGWPGLVAFPVDYIGRSFVDGLGWNLVRNLYALNIAIKEGVGLAALRVGL